MTHSGEIYYWGRIIKDKLLGLVTLAWVSYMIHKTKYQFDRYALFINLFSSCECLKVF